MNKSVNFDIAKLLKDKGCDIQSAFVYKTENNKTFVLIPSGLNPMDGLFSTYSAPKIAKVVMWLYEKHGIWISVAPRFNNDNSLWFVYESLILSTNNMTTLNDNLFKGHFNEMFETPTEAYSAAILYTLNSLI